MTMKHKEHIHECISKMVEDLNDRGWLSTAYLMRKYKLERPHARFMLHVILEDFTNIKEDCQDRIYIDGNKIEKPKKPRKRKEKVAKWKDVTKP